MNKKAKMPHLKSVTTRSIQRKKQKHELPQKMREHIVCCYKSVVKCNCKQNKLSTDDIRRDTRGQFLQTFAELSRLIITLLMTI